MDKNKMENLPAYYKMLEQHRDKTISNLAGHPEATQYLSSRGLSSKTISDFGVGFDFGRITLPLYVPREEGSWVCAGMQGRSIDNAEPKYTNSHNSVYFKKSYCLFGIQVAMEHVERSQVVYVVEGPFDAMMMYQCGYKSTVATMGSKMSDVQALTLKEITGNVVVVYDGDDAGRDGMADACIKLMSVGIRRPLGMLVPLGSDPHSTLLEFGSLKHSTPIPLIDMWYNQRKTAKQTVGGKYEFIKELVQAYNCNQDKEEFIGFVTGVLNEV